MPFYRCGGGADTSGVTAAAEDVLTPKKIVDQDGEEVTGTMPDNGAVLIALNAGQSYTVPAGYHNGAGKVQANNLSGQTDGTATADKILKGYTAWAKGNKVTGTKEVTIDGKEIAGNIKLKEKYMGSIHSVVPYMGTYPPKDMLIYQGNMHILLNNSSNSRIYKYVSGNNWTRVYIDRGVSAANNSFAIADGYLWLLFPSGSTYRLRKIKMSDVANSAVYPENITELPNNNVYDGKVIYFNSSIYVAANARSGSLCLYKYNVASNTWTTVIENAGIYINGNTMCNIFVHENALKICNGQYGAYSMNANGVLTKELDNKLLPGYNVQNYNMQLTNFELDENGTWHLIAVGGNEINYSTPKESASSFYSMQHYIGTNNAWTLAGNLPTVLTAGCAHITHGGKIYYTAHAGTNNTVMMEVIEKVYVNA